MKKSAYQYSKRAPVEQRTGPDNFIYDSKTEMERGIQLQLLERGKVISGLQRQVTFPLILQSDPTVKIMAGEKISVYTPDFVYFDEDGTRVVEDVKGYAFEGAKIRIRVFEAFYNQKVTIVRKTKRGWVQE